MIKRKATHKEEVTIKTEHHQEEVTLGSKRKRAGGMHQNIHSKLSYEDRCYSAMANYFICSSECLLFRTFRDDSCSQMMNTVAGANGF